jgi:hypothetical protein
MDVDPRMERWARFCQAAATVYRKSFQYFADHDQPGKASWFDMGAQVWESIGAQPGLMARYYDEVNDRIGNGSAATVAHVAQFLAGNIEPRDHWYVEVLRRTGDLWLATFAQAPAKPLGPGTRTLDWVERAMAEAMKAARGPVGCNCPQCCQRVAQFDEWVKRVGEPPSRG